MLSLNKTTIKTNNIGKCRQCCNLTQKQLADKLGWTLRKLTSYERGERIPPLTEAWMIVEALGADFYDLWEFEIE